MFYGVAESYVACVRTSIRKTLTLVAAFTGRGQSSCCRVGSVGATWKKIPHKNGVISVWGQRPTLEAYAHNMTRRAFERLHKAYLLSKKTKVDSKTSTTG